MGGESAITYNWIVTLQYDIARITYEEMRIWVEYRFSGDLAKSAYGFGCNSQRLKNVGMCTRNILTSLNC